MKKTLLVFVGILLISAAVFAGGGQAVEEKEVVTFYTWAGSSEKTLHEAIIAEFEANNPGVKIERNFMLYNDYSPKINTMIAANAPPDIFHVQEFLVNDYGEKGVGKDVRPVFASRNMNVDTMFLEKYLFQTQGKTWAVGVNPATIILYYNKDLFREAGVAFPPESATNPWTWAQFVDAAKKLTKDSTGKTPNDAGFNPAAITQYGAILPTGQLQLYLSFLYSAGTSVANQDGTGLAMNGATGTQVIQNIANLALVDKVAPTAAMRTASAFANVATMLMNNQAAMWVDGTYQYSNFANENYDVGVAQIPTMGSTGGNVTWNAGFMLGKNASSAAEDFYVYFTNFNNWVTVGKKHNVSIDGYLPTTASTLNDPALNAAWIALNHPEMAKLCGDIIQNASALGENVTLKNWAEIFDQIIIPEFDKVLLGNETAADAMRNLPPQLEGKFQGVWR
ncbi:MAG: extracellular solute-binding protein [Treponema sp.]|jgi:multiple sugar transport system substrate-binding protein|nr:extracellular solute-binding protein [Treponema sp.]